MDLLRLSKVAKKEEKAELVLKNCQIVNVFDRSIEHNDIAIEDGYIVGIGNYNGKREIDIKNQFVAPGLIDGHVHIESSMLTPSEFSKIIMPKGTTTVIADPHEIANVIGIEGIKYMVESSKKTPLDVNIMIPSCVPATVFESNGAIISSKEIKKLKTTEGILGLGEVMDYVSVINGEEGMIKKLKTMKDFIIDGHAPNVTNEELNAYLISGIKTDHECTTVLEMQEKLKRGMYIHLREGSATRNVEALSKGVTKDNSHRLMFCTDDKHPEDIRKEGHINFNINKAIENKVDPLIAIQMATINTATCYNLKQQGAIAPGYFADLIVFKTLDKIEPNLVFKNGVLVAKDNVHLFETTKYVNSDVLKTVKFNFKDINLDLKLKSNKVKVIKLIEQNVITKQVIKEVEIENGIYVNNEEDDILKIAVIERHHYTKNIGLGLLTGYGLKNGAIGMSIAHDSHNLIVVGDNDEDMIEVIKELKRIEGGIVVASKGKVIDYLQLEIAGLMTNQDIEVVESKLKNLNQAARKLGVKKEVDDPFLSLAFMSLPVIPDLKLTDKGLFDVTKFELVEIEAD
ncbi:adenine deaminase [Candidatus Izimaplasma bacterium ZiA1]|uniref:adenine deaminase n=1 Tax=Candidatus Izimoplasma sp. ZiA1 TaxID=2024899 RepID=UPI000BAA5355|nr:adenine deaminase [Candidatus Izimaplasma bacterium ZiA1]